MKYTTFEELEDIYLGKVGTPGRDAYEAEVREAIQSYSAKPSKRPGKSAILHKTS